MNKILTCVCVLYKIVDMVQFDEKEVKALDEAIGVFAWIMLEAVKLKAYKEADGFKNIACNLRITRDKIASINLALDGNDLGEGLEVPISTGFERGVTGQLIENINETRDNE